MDNVVDRVIPVVVRSLVALLEVLDRTNRAMVVVAADVLTGSDVVVVVVVVVGVVVSCTM